MFNCHSEKIYHIWLALDLAGISLALCGCYVPSVYYAFYCQPVCKVSSLLYQMIESYLLPDFEGKSITLMQVFSKASFRRRTFHVPNPM